MVSLLISLLVLALIAYLVWWAIGAMGLPDPIKTVFLVIMLIILILVLVRAIPGVNIM